MGVNLLGKIKLYELAKEMNVASKELLEKAKKMGIELKSHLSVLTDEDAILSSKNCMQLLMERLNKYEADLKPRQETIDMYKRFVKVYKSTNTNELTR